MAIPPIHIELPISKSDYLGKYIEIEVKENIKSHYPPYYVRDNKSNELVKEGEMACLFLSEREEAFEFWV